MTAQSIGIIVAATCGYLWISSPELQPYSLQFTAVLFLAFMLLQKVAGKRMMQLGNSTIRTESPGLPDQLASLQLSLLVIALCVLIGSTGGISSIFLPLAYGLLFLAVLTLHTTTIITLTAIFPLFLWAIASSNGQQLSFHDVATLITFPALLPMLIFARGEHQQIQQVARELNDSATYTEDHAIFLSTFLLPKLEHLLELSQYPDHNTETIQRQILLILEATKDLMENQSS